MRSLPFFNQIVLVKCANTMYVPLYILTERNRHVRHGTVQVILQFEVDSIINFLHQSPAWKL